MIEPKCLFCKIMAGDIPSRKIYEDERTFAFEDIHPQAPTHILIVPKQHLSGIAEMKDQDADLMGALMLAAKRIAERRGLPSGYRLVINQGPDAGQEVFHLHVHLLGGRKLAWPPG